MFWSDDIPLRSDFYELDSLNFSGRTAPCSMQGKIEFGALARCVDNLSRFEGLVQWPGSSTGSPADRGHSSHLQRRVGIH
jgi:hypothetical protein